MTNPIDRLFIEHPRAIGESYTEHFGIAAGVGWAMLTGGLACFVHALVPNLFQRTGSSTIKRLYPLMVSRLPNAGKFAHQDPLWQVEYEI